MTKFTKLALFLGVLIGVVIVVAIVQRRTSRDTIRYGISPYQDTAMPKVAEGMGLYQKNGLNVELVTVAWEDVVPSLASAERTVDVAIGSINTLLPRAENINVKGGGDVVFYFPLYVFKGASLMIHGDGKIKPLSEFIARNPGDRDRAVREAMQQLRGKTIAVPSGTPYEQMLFAALATAGMDPKKDIQLRDVQLANSLYAFRNGEADVVGAGVTQRTEAMREGGVVFMDMEEFGFAETIGLVTTRRWANSHKNELDKLIQIWFKSVDALLSDMDANSPYVLKYLEANASTKYSLAEYKQALSFQYFPRTPEEDRRLILEPTGTFYWKRTWDIVNTYLLSSNKITTPIPYDYFIGNPSPRQLVP